MTRNAHTRRTPPRSRNDNAAQDDISCPLTTPCTRISPAVREVPRLPNCGQSLIHASRGAIPTKRGFEGKSVKKPGHVGSEQQCPRRGTESSENEAWRRRKARERPGA